MAKLEIGAVDDPLEREADAVADRVMGMPAPSHDVAEAPASEPDAELEVGEEEEASEAPPVTAFGGAAAPPDDRGSIAQRKCASCEAEDDELHRSVSNAVVMRTCETCEDEEIHRMCSSCEDEEEIRRSAASCREGGPATDAFTRSVQGELRGGGRPLDEHARRFLEPRLGVDLGYVRVHDDRAAGTLAASVRARAFALGDHIFFAVGEYSDSFTGRHLLAHEVAHTLQRRSYNPETHPWTLRRSPPTATKTKTETEELHEYLEKRKDTSALEVMGELSESQVATVLADADFRSLAVKAFSNKQMHEGILTMGGQLFPSLEWMFAEGTKWKYVKEVIEGAPASPPSPAPVGGAAGGEASGYLDVLGDNTMRKSFVKICNKAEMAEAVGLLGGDLTTQLEWMQAEGTTWELMKGRITDHSAGRGRTILYDDGNMNALFVAECDGATIIEAVKLLGGTLLQQLTWVSAAGTSWKYLKPLVSSSDYSDEHRADLYNHRSMYLLFESACDKEQVAEAVQVLKGTLFQQLRWLQDKGTTWELVKARVLAFDLADRTKLYAESSMRSLFTSVCNKRAIKEAVLLLAGTLSQQLNWVAAVGSNWELLKVIVTSHTSGSRGGVLGDANLRALFVDACSKKEMADAVAELDGTLLEKLQWLKAKGTTWKLVERTIKLPWASAEGPAVLADVDMKNYLTKLLSKKQMWDLVSTLAPAGTSDAYDMVKDKKGIVGNCTPIQVASIYKGHIEAMGLLARTIRQLESDPLPAHVETILDTHFDTHSSPMVFEVHRRLKELHRRLPLETYTCEPSSAKYCGGPSDAYTIWIFGKIHTCPNFFALPTARDRGIVVIHEAAHRIQGATDAAYEWEGKYATLGPASKRLNADSYAQLCDDLG